MNSIKPDVLLLQETTDKLIRRIIEQCQDRSYLSEVAGDKKEARILYDSDIFERLIPHGSQSAKSNLLNCLAAEFPQRYIIRKRNGDVHFISSQEFFDYRVAAVRLKHKDTGEVIVFMSFHNKRTGAPVLQIATDFCTIVSKTADKEHEHTLVVAGADLNCKNFERQSAHVLDYDLTPRKRYAVDYIVSDWPRCITVKSDVRAEDVTAFPGPPCPKKQYKKSLDHDPLVSRFKVCRGQGP